MAHDTDPRESTGIAEMHICVAAPPGLADECAATSLLSAVARAGELPVLDAGAACDFAGFERQFEQLHGLAGRRLCLRVDEQRAAQLAAFIGKRGAHLDFLIVSCASNARDYASALAALRPYATTIFCEVVSLDEAQSALAAGANGLLAKGNEAGGRVGSETTFVLLQRLAGRVSAPIWVQGGISPRTLAACRLAGASGTLLDSQLALAEESVLHESARLAFAAMDGTQTVCLGESLDAGYRVHRMFGRSAVGELQQLQHGGAEARNDFIAALNRALTNPIGEEGLLVVGQDGAFAAKLAAKHRHVGGILRAYRRQSTDCLRLAADALALSENAALAQAHATRYPIVQGPMTRVSDVAAFAHAVAQEGGLPFLALALLREAAATGMLEETAAALGDAPWGVGILGFVPAEIRNEQLRAVRAVRPPFAILAGGRPDQARELDESGTTTYIHTPSPRLLEMFLKDGARRFVFEGRECGGHVGPLSSFVLWESVLEVLLEFQVRGEPRDSIDVLFAGGVHDALSAGMVAALAAQAAQAGIRIGVLMGTAYLFTHEAVESGAIVEGFQEQALDCVTTIILDADGGHAVRCAPTAYEAQFNAVKRGLQQAGHPPERIRAELEDLHVGRLRMASKGLMRIDADGGGTNLVEVPLEQQREQGMYMVGQVGALRTQLCTIETLHHEVSTDSSALLQKAVATMMSTGTLARRADRGRRDAPEPIAIVGMACLYPGASDLGGYWENILRRHNAVREVPQQRWDANRFYSAQRGSREHVTSKWGGFIEPIQFDPMHYGIPPTSLTAVEPLQLLMLEVVRRALSDCGYDKRPLPRERTAVIVGSGGMPCEMGSMFETRTLLAHYIEQLTDLSAEVREQVVTALRRSLAPLTEDSFAGILPNVLAGRVANRFDFGGPNFTVDAACGSSLAALESAIKELRQGSSDLAVIGGADAHQNLFAYRLFSSVGALSARGQCRPFDEKADGIAISDGVAALIAKRFTDAVREGDRIYAVIRHVGASSDGRDKSLTAPSVRGQRRAVERAYAPLEIDPRQVGLVEAHGTGTVAGDRAEVETLQLVFRDADVPNQHSALGSVKSQIGHAKNAAGLAGIIKCALALHHRVLPPTLFDKPNPAIRDRAQPFYLLSRPRPWFQSNREPRRAGVSAFGFGGTNFHAVLEEYRPDSAALGVRSAELVVFRAASRPHLVEQLSALRASLASAPSVRLIDVAAAAQRAEKKATGGCRLALVATSLPELRQQLEVCAKQLRDGAALPAIGPMVYAEQAAMPAGSVALLFPGQGSQYLHMMEELALNFPVVREQFEIAERALGDILPLPLLDVIFPPTAYDDDEETEQRKRLSQTRYTQPSLGAADFAMYTLLVELGVRFDFVAGHSYGEYVALCIAGVFNYQDLIRLSEARGRVVHETQGEDAVAMLAVTLPVEQLEPLVAAHPGVSIATVNAPSQCTVGGGRDAIDAFMKRLASAEIAHRKLPMSAGFHIPEALAAAAAFARITAALQFHAPRLPVYSGLTANVYPAEAGGIRRILLDQLTKTVRFKDQIEALYRAGARTFIEAGPGHVLSGLARQTLNDRPANFVVTNRLGSANAMADLLGAVARLFVNGASLSLEKLFAGCALAESSLEALEKPAASMSALTQWVDTLSVRPMRDAPTPSIAAPSSRESATISERAAAPVVVAASQPTARVAGIEALPATLQAFLRDYEAREAQAQREREQLLNRFLAQQTASMAAPSHVHADAPVSVVERSQPELKVVVSEPAPVIRGDLPETAAVGHERSEDSLLEVVSQRTGYPRELLQLDQNMEADLGIDSIKRTEIFGALRERMQLRSGAGGAESFFSAASRLRTLREVMQWLDRQRVQVPVAPLRAVNEPPLAVAVSEPQIATVAAAAAPALPMRDALLEVVSQRTGYPREMLQLDQNMEADLGIDSIKRTEIFGALRERMQLPTGAGGAESFFSAASRLRTLREVMQWLEKQRPAAAAHVAVSDTASSLRTPTVAVREAATETHSARRYVVRARAAELTAAGPLSISFHRPDWAELTRIAHSLTARQWGVVLITEDAGGRAAAIAAVLSGGDFPVCVALVRHGKQLCQRSFGVYEADLLCAQSLAALRDRIQHDLGAVTDLWHLLPLDAGTVNGDSVEVRTLFMLATVFGPGIASSRGTLIAATGMDGALGLQGGAGQFNPGQAAVPGLIKSLAQEWPNCVVRCWDSSPVATAEVVYGQALQEFSAVAGATKPIAAEVAYSPTAGRLLLVNEEAAIERTAGAQLSLNADCVILVTGGSRGIAAHVCRELVRRYGCTIVIAGRSPQPEQEGAQTAQLTEAVQIKRALAQQHGVTLTPKELKTQYDRLMAGREMQQTFADLKAHARSFEYHSLDVRNAGELTALVEAIYRRHGRIDGVIHAAGVVDDTLVLNKTPAAFDTVYDTKVVPALTLAKVLKPLSLQFFAFFSSVAARFGCSGGADYAAANEVLNKLAWKLNRDWPTRVVAIGWGPWSDVGLATRYSQEMHGERGFDWLPIEVGCRCFMDEIEFGRKEDAEVVIFVPKGAGPQQAENQALAI